MSVAEWTALVLFAAMPFVIACVVILEVCNDDDAADS